MKIQTSLLLAILFWHLLPLIFGNILGPLMKTHTPNLEIKFHFCKHCECRTTGKTGFFNRSHSSCEHRFGSDKGNSSTAETGDSGASANMTPVEEVKPKTEEPSVSIDDEDDLIFQGAFVSDAADEEAWVATKSNTY